MGNKNETLIYLAGKISKHGWREEIIDTIDDDRVWMREEENCWPVVTNKKDGLRFSGPFFMQLDNENAHGGTSHGVGAQYGYISSFDTYTRKDILQLCLSAIRQANFIFAWIDQEDVYGTLAELGYAHAHKKYIAIASPLRNYEHWMAYEMATYSTFGHTSVKKAFNECLREFENNKHDYYKYNFDIPSISDYGKTTEDDEDIPF